MLSQQSVALREEYSEGYCELTYASLDVLSVVESVKSHRAGALAIFVGTTRDTFQGTYSALPLPCHTNSDDRKINKLPDSNTKHIADWQYLQCET
jgi:molybdopterin synthase catalytic subunit